MEAAGRLEASRTCLPQPKPSAYACFATLRHKRSNKMNGIIYLVGLVVVILAILSFFGLR